MSSTDLEAEQAHVDHARACLDRMRKRAENTLEFGERAARDEKTVDAMITRSKLLQRRHDLEMGTTALCFGRIDDDSDRYHIGRRHIEDGTGEPVVVDWRAPVAIPFYRATALDPLGLTLRRRFTTEGDQITSIFDEHLDDPESLGAAGIPDPLLAEIERGRSGEMADIVATIAAEQDKIIRAPIDELLVVQGGPGTGKTAVGLHRAAFLLFEHRRTLSADRVLVIGPSRLFLRYVGNVLPSLGETAVTEATVESLLAATFPVRAAEPDHVVALKGDARMSTVVARAVRDTIRPPADGVRLPVGARNVVLAADDIAQAQKIALCRELPLNQARSVYRELLLRRAWTSLLDRGADPGTETIVMGELRGSDAFKRLVDRSWPTTSAAAVLRALYGNRRVRARATAGVMHADEAAALHRTSAKKLTDETWTAADIPLLDEAQALVAGTGTRYGHVVIDEAQDLSSMALRMVARRAGRGSMTVLGDLAQATAIGAAGSWDRVVEDLAGSGETRLRRTELTVGYRVPGPILEFANRLLPRAAADITPPTSIRTRGEPPLVLPVEADRLLETTAHEVAALTEQWSSIGVIAADHLIDAILTTFEAEHLAATDTRRQLGLDGAVAVTEARTAKGLEFDAVVVVEPSDIGEQPNGLRLLYVALTRPVQHLAIIHSRPLPEPLR